MPDLVACKRVWRCWWLSTAAFTPTVMFMRPGAVERWRVMNASSDGRGTKNFMVLEGQFVFSDRQLWKVLPAQGAAGARRLEPRPPGEDVARATRQLHQLSFDGITLVQVENGRPRYTIADLAAAERRQPRTRSIASRRRVKIRREPRCATWRTATRRRQPAQLHIRPNQMLLSNANRADVLFKAPLERGRQGVHGVRAGVSAWRRITLSSACRSAIGSGGSGFSAGNPRPSTWSWVTSR